MSTFPLQMITPEKIFFEGDVQRVIVRTTEGDVGILAKHEKYVAALPSGPVKVIMADGTLWNGQKILISTGRGALRRMLAAARKTAKISRNCSLRR